MRQVLAAALAAIIIGGSVQAFEFPSIDGGTLKLDDWAGKPVLVVNTASRCGFTPQYDGLQRLHERYSDAGLVVLAVPSNDFRQELASEAEVRDFCEVNFGLTLPMTEITHVRGAKAHPFYQWLSASHGFTPRWNFNKVLIAPDGSVAGMWGSTTRPSAPEITGRIEAFLAQ